VISEYGTGERRSTALSEVTVILGEIYDLSESADFFVCELAAAIMQHHEIRRIVILYNMTTSRIINIIYLPLKLEPEKLNWKGFAEIMFLPVFPTPVLPGSGSRSFISALHSSKAPPTDSQI
jgi:hypothetical protein